MSLCKLIKDELKYDAVFCLKPNTCEGGLTQACHAVDYQGVEYYLDFWDKKYIIKLFVNHSNSAIRISYNNKQKSFDCLSPDVFTNMLYDCNKEALILFLHSLFCRMMRLGRAAAAAAAAAYAARTAYDDAHDAYAAAHDAADAADAARKAFKALIKLRKIIRDDIKNDKN